MKKKKIVVKMKLPGSLYRHMLADLKRPHRFAYERVGFVYAKTTVLSDGTYLINYIEYNPVADEHYVEDDSVGARIGSAAIRGAMQKILDENYSGFHVHLHNHIGQPRPSGDDKEGLPGIVESFANVKPNQPHGILILSKDSFYALVKVNGERHFVIPEIIAAVQYPMVLQFPGAHTLPRSNVLQRQSFLGERSTSIFEHLKVVIVGLGGGGSHLVQQLAHLGVKNFILFDFDRVEDSNLNRLVGAYFKDIAHARLKTEIARRIILNINPDAEVRIVNSRWQENAEALQVGDVVFGCVDTYEGRSQLEAECRRYLLPFIDIGMDVHNSLEGNQISGQVILSMHGQACMRCMGFITEEKLATEAAKYGNVGGRPQVIWPNGLLASSAIGIFTDLVTGWSGQKNRLIYMAYDGNTGLLNNHIRLNFMEDECVHYSLLDLGQPVFKKL
jgi:hypothetical protein